MFNGNIVFLCLAVFIARIVDTSLSTIKTVLIVKDKTMLAMAAAFFEVLVWFLIVREALATEANPLLIALSYGAGYSCGTLVGMYLTSKFIVSNVSVNIVVKQKKEIVDILIKNNFAVSVSKIKGKDLKSDKYMIFVATTNRRVSELKKLVTEIDDHAFIVVSENKYRVGGY